MIFSRWRPDTGGYDYYDSPSTRYGLGDDLPVPNLPKTTELGTASTDVGRPLPLDAVHVGSGPLARGMIAPMSTAGLSGLGLDLSNPQLQLGLAVVAALGVGYFVGKKIR